MTSFLNEIAFLWETHEQVSTTNGLAVAIRKSSSIALAPDCDDELLRQVLLTPGVRSLIVSGCHAVSDSAFSCIASALDLRQLSISYCEELTGATVQSLVRAIHLRKLDISGCCNLTNGTDGTLEGIEAFSDLEILNAGWIPLLENRVCERLTHLRNLRSLSLMGCGRLSSEGIQQLTRCRSLEVLVLPFFTDIDDATVLSVCASLPRLRSLCFGHLEKVTDAVVDGISESHQIEEVELHSCPGISEAAAVRMAGSNHLRRLRLGKGMISEDAIAGIRRNNRELIFECV